MFLPAEDAPAAIASAWDQLESRFESLQGRKFFGAFDPSSNEYRACVQTQPGDDASLLGLREGELPGGAYARVRLRGEPPAIYGEIARGFEQLEQRWPRDGSRPSIEFYRRRDEIDLLLPI
jgi:hypothetical protein